MGKYKKFGIVVVSVLFGLSAYAQTKIYPYMMSSKKHPDYNRYHIKAPTPELFGNQTAFIALRSIANDFKASMDRYIERDKLGNVIWPPYSIIYRKDLEAIVDEIAKRKYYLFNLWGYVPGPGEGKSGWMQYRIPDGVLDMFEKKLGDHWLGMDNGEQDGRYVAWFSPRQHDYGADKFHQYLNFQKHFQQLGDEMGNKLSTLVSLNFGHYFLKEGIYTMIGAETAQALPNSQVYYSFIRGACKQYGVPWFGNASAFNRWGWKEYHPNPKFKRSGPSKGTSLSLHKRLIYNHIMYNCIAVGFELGLYYGNGKLSPIGEILQSAHKWTRDNGNVGVMQTPIAVMTDFYSGWTFPRHLYTAKIFKVWGNLSYQDGDYLMDNVFRQLYPSYQDCSYFKNERGFITPTPYGDSVDALFSDAPLWVLQQYPLLVIANEIQPSAEVNDNLNAYVNNGGKLVITAGSLKNMKDGIAGVKAGSVIRTLDAPVVMGDKNIAEETKFDLCELSLPKNAQIIARVGNMPAAVSVKSGKGEVIVIASPFGLSKYREIKDRLVYVDHFKPRENVGADGEVGRTFPTPYPMLKYVEAILDKEYRNCMLFETNPELSMIVCGKNKDEYTVLISNDKWEEKPFEIKSKIGEITEIKELTVPITEVGEIGHTPEIIDPKTLGKNTEKTIAGGDLRIFSVKVKDSNAVVMQESEPVKNPVGRALTLRDTLDIKTEILARPTFFQHFDRIVVDWRYFEVRTKSALNVESGWIKRHKLKISVDFSSGINLFPDLRIVENDKQRYEDSIKRIKRVVDKAKILGVDEIIIAPMGSIEQNMNAATVTKENFRNIAILADMVAEKGMTLFVRTELMRLPANILDLAAGLKNLNKSNLKLAPSTAMLLDDNVSEADLDLLSVYPIQKLVVADTYYDAFGQMRSISYPIHKNKNPKLVKILKMFKDSEIICDAIFSNKDEEYKEAKFLSEIHK